jgi:HAD superfamily hydrolase (TIGR01484 family)
MSPLPLREFLATSAIRFLLFDVDDTFTLHGEVNSNALMALERWREAGKIAVAVTGRPAGWCDHMARMWPIDGVIGENGAFWFRYQKDHRRMDREMIGKPAPDEELRERLSQIAQVILSEFPKARISADQSYRLYDLAIDFAEDVTGMDLNEAHLIAQRFESFGMTAKVSSIHVNAWFGQHNKASTVKRYLAECHALDSAQQNQHVVFVGDSPNDEPLFEALPLSVGVANIQPHLINMRHKPRYVTSNPEGQGFVELIEHALKL